LTADTFDRLDDAMQRAMDAKQPSATFRSSDLDIEKVGEWGLRMVLERAQAMPQDDIRGGSFLGFATAAVIHGLAVGIELGREEGGDREARCPLSSPGARRSKHDMPSKLRGRLNVSPRAVTAEPPGEQLACSYLALRLEVEALRAQAGELQGKLDEAVRVGRKALRRETAAHLELERLGARIAANSAFERIAREG